MALTQIYWTQIDTENIPSGSVIILGSQLLPLEKIYVKELISSGAIILSGSLETDGDVFISGSLQVNGDTPVYMSQFNEYTSSMGTNIWQQTGSFYGTTNDLQITGSMILKGDLKVEGQTILSSDIINRESLIISGAMSVVQNEIESQIQAASLRIEGLGSWGNPSRTDEIDLGEFF